MCLCNPLPSAVNAAKATPSHSFIVKDHAADNEKCRRLRFFSRLLVVVEFKQPGRDDYDAKNNPIEQAFKLIDRIRRGKAEKDGMQIRVQSEMIPAWAYIVCDLTDGLKDIARWRGLLDTVDGECRYQYFPELRIYVEIIPYDKSSSTRRSGTAFCSRA